MSARKPTRAAIYCRISSDREGTELGVQRQEQDCRELAAELGWTLYPSRPVFVDNDKGASIRSRKRRRDWDAMFDAVRAGAVDGIIYYSNSRLTRRSREYLDVVDLVADTGVQLASVMSTKVDLTTASGRLIGKILADVDAHDAEVRAELVARRWQQRRETGHPHSTGFRPFGFGWTGTDENGKRKDFDHDKINDVEAQAIRDAARMILDGASLGDVVTAWTGRVLPVNGGRWSRTTVRRALTRPRVAGLIEHKGRIEVNGDGTPLRITDDDGKLCPPILGAETWAQVCDRISDRSSLVRARYRGREHLLSGLLVCGLCGRPMKVSARRAEDGTVRADSFVACQKDSGGCGHIKRNLLLVEAFVLPAVEARLGRIGELIAPDDVEDAAEVARLVAERDMVTVKIEALHSRYLTDPDLDAADYAPLSRKLRDRLNELEALLDEHSEPRPELGPDPVAAWRAGGFIERRELIEAVVESIVLGPIGNVGPTRARALVPERTDIRWR